MKTKIESLLREFICENLLFAEEGLSLNADDSLLARGVIDSTGIMELVEYVSNRFGIEVPMKDINQENFDSIGRLVDYICRRQGERQTRHGEPARAQEIRMPTS